MALPARTAASASRKFFIFLLSSQQLVVNLNPENPAPQGAFNSKCLSACLKACPDTNPSCTRGALGFMPNPTSAPANIAYDAGPVHFSAVCKRHRPAAGGDPCRQGYSNR